MVEDIDKKSGIEQVKSDVQVRKTPQQSRAKQKVAKILEGAKAILQREGRKGLSARKLAKECGLSASSIYDYFPSIAAIIYQLCEERLDQELEIFQKIEREDTGELSMLDVMDLFAEADKSLLWGGAVDVELDEAFKDDPKLRQLDDHHMELKRDLFVKVLRRRDSRISDSKLNALVRYLLELNDLSFKLRHVDKIGEEEFILDLSYHLAKQAVEYSGEA